VSADALHAKLKPQNFGVEAIKKFLLKISKDEKLSIVYIHPKDDVDIPLIDDAASSTSSSTAAGIGSALLASLLESGSLFVREPPIIAPKTKPKKEIEIVQLELGERMFVAKLSTKVLLLSSLVPSHQHSSLIQKRIEGSREEDMEEFGFDSGDVLDLPCKIAGLQRTPLFQTRES
jgi:hypothetical protein